MLLLQCVLVEWIFIKLHNSVGDFLVEFHTQMYVFMSEIQKSHIYK
jgi:hypothetical protein